ncbi:sulfite exporter TauE/SafE family protein [Virgibacillus halodenitrificans]|uniref:urease accessory protein UreH domain-containing protein n=1 Tax=Virgibacillus halodenitrificans TaxID=1482 RepID=UPI0024C08902|nr:sulfite exporter TauE/SafE family protein [Virgibacillus halodenitrificans]WHX27859.1 sulfite exporter TauE/SafE family protein [Virgibacillus halodenitrificans]
MFELYNQIASLFSRPLQQLAYGWEHLPILFAFFLGLVGAVAPCQLTGNISAITIYGNRSLTYKVPWLHVWVFIIGKIIVFSGLGFLIWLLGKDIHSSLTLVFPVLRKIIGPMLMLIGLFMLGIFHVRQIWPFYLLRRSTHNRTLLGSFFLGITFSIALCPTMFVLFFLTLIPIVLSSPYGAVLPAFFALGTSLPLLLIIFLIWYFGASGAILKKSRKIGQLVQTLAGIVIIIIGFFDTVTYWL